MGWDGNTAQTVSFVIALLVWLRVYKGGWITGFFYYIGVASPLWHVVNGEQMYADGAWGATAGTWTLAANNGSKAGSEVSTSLTIG